jgi:hypothetical protein
MRKRCLADPKNDAGAARRKKSQSQKSPNRFVKEKDEPIKCASPPCYLSEIED